MKLVPLLLCLLAFGMYSKAQDSYHPVRSLRIGDTMPDIVLQKMRNYHSAQGKISDFRGKLLILDFWATWCGACIAMQPRMDSLQYQFARQVQFLPVTYESEEQVNSVLSKVNRKYKRLSHIPEVVEDTILRNFFYHNTYPHYVWIDGKGIVRAFTGMEEISEKNILALLDNERLVLREKKDAVPLPYNLYKPLLIDGNGGDGGNMLYHSVFTGFTEGLGFGYSILRDSTAHFRITIKNNPRVWFYKIAYSVPGKEFNDANTVYKVKNPGRLTSDKIGQDYEEYLRDNNGFCYELAVSLDKEKMAFALMQRDLDFLFPEYAASVEKEKRKCLVLKRNDKNINLKTAGNKFDISLDPYEWSVQNAFIGQIVGRLNRMQRYPLTIVDETGIKDRVDLKINAGLPDLEAVNKELDQYGLIFEIEEKEVEVLIISDNV